MFGPKRVLLDENVPKQLLRFVRRTHNADHALDVGLRGVKNGALLRRLREDKYWVLVTTDQNIEYQNEMSSQPFGRVVITRNNWPDMRAGGASFMADLNAAIVETANGQITVVEVLPRPKK